MAPAPAPGPWHSKLHIRHAFIGAMLDAGHDLATAQQLAGHASPTTSARYVRRGRRATKARATAKLAFPDGAGRGRPGGDDRMKGEA